MATTQYTVCFVTASDKASAASLARGLVAGKFAACVSIVDNISSAYRWEGKIETAKESLLIIKTRKNLMEDVQQFIRNNHTAKTPEVIFMDITGGSRPYLDWVGANTLFSSNIAKDKTKHQL